MSRSLPRRALPFALAAALVGGGAYAYLRATRVAPETVEVRTQALRQTIVSSGQVMPPAEVRLEALVTSTVRAIPKREGDTVKAGELLVLLDDREIGAARAQAEAAVAQARAGKSSLKATSLPQANEVLAQVRANLAEARAELDRQKKLFEADVTTRTALEKAQSAVDIFESQEKAALLQVQAASSGGSASLTASAAIALAEAQLAAVKVTEDRVRITAPMDGVISARRVEVGEVVRPGTPLMVLTASGRTRVVLEPDERNLALIALGQEAAVSAEAYPTQSFRGQVGYIAPAVNGERGTIEVRLDVPEPPPYLRPNMTVSVELRVAERASAVTVPVGAVQDLSGAQPWVGVLGPRSEVERRDVRLGLRGDADVEVLDGLVDGERVVLTPPTVPSVSKTPPPMGQ